MNLAWAIIHVGEVSARTDDSLDELFASRAAAAPVTGSSIGVIESRAQSLAPITRAVWIVALVFARDAWPDGFEVAGRVVNFAIGASAAGTSLPA